MNNKRRRQRDRGKRKGLRKILRQKARGGSVHMSPELMGAMIYVGKLYTEGQIIEMDLARMRLKALERGPRSYRDLCRAAAAPTFDFSMHEMTSGNIPLIFGKDIQS